MKNIWEILNEPDYIPQRMQFWNVLSIVSAFASPVCAIKKKVTMMVIFATLGTLSSFMLNQENAKYMEEILQRTKKG